MLNINLLARSHPLLVKAQQYERYKIILIILLSVGGLIIIHVGLFFMENKIHGRLVRKSVQLKAHAQSSVYSVIDQPGERNAMLKQTQFLGLFFQKLNQSNDEVQIDHLQMTHAAFTVVGYAQSILSFRQWIKMLGASVKIKKLTQVSYSSQLQFHVVVRG